jgi:hypothetical protein
MFVLQAGTPLQMELHYVHKKLQSPSSAGLNNRNVNLC